MAETKTRLDDLLGTLQRVRDELALQIHLGGKDARDEWKRQEKKFSELKQQARPYGEAIGETAGNVGVAAELAAKELHAGYKKVRELLDS